MTRPILSCLTSCAVALAVMLVTSCSDTPEGLVASAKNLLAKGDANAAVIQLRNALQKDPNLAEARFLLGKAELDTGQFEAAQKDLQRALELKYAADDVVPPLAESMYGSGEFKKVIDEFGRVIKIPEAPAADLPAALAAAVQQLKVHKANEAEKVEDASPVTAPTARAELQTTVGKAYLALNKLSEAGAAFEAALASKADYPPAMLGQAAIAAQKGDFPGATTIVAAALAKAPNYAEGWQFQGQVQSSQGLQDEALASYRKALGIKPNAIAVHAAIVTVLAQQRKYDDAAKQLQSLQKIAPKDPQTLYLQAELAYWRKDFPAAREAIQAMLGATPENSLGQLLSGAVNFELASYAQAEADLLKVLSAQPRSERARRLLVGTYLRAGRPDKAMETIRPVLDAIGDNSDWLSLAGEVYIQNGNANEAARYFEKAAALDPKDLRKKTTVALVHAVQGDNQKAVPELEQAAIVDQTTRPDLALIAVYMRDRDFPKALAAIAALEKKDPTSPLPHNLRGEILMEQGDAAGARQSWERALTLDPGYFPAAERLARMDLANNKPDDARKRMDSVLAKDPKHTQALLALAEMRAIGGGSPDEVAALIGKAIAANPTEIAPRRILIAHWLRNNDPKKAAAAARDALAAIPDRPEILDAVGRAQEAANEFNDAIATYGQWVRLQPTSPMPLLRMATAQAKANEMTGAMQNLRKALDLSPGLIEAQRGIIGLELASNHVPQALAVAQEIQKQRPKEGIGFLIEGDIFASTSDWPRAIAAYRNGLQRAPNSTDLAVRLHAVLYASGNAGEAERYAAKWIKENPKDKVFRLRVADEVLKRKNFVGAYQNYVALYQMDPTDVLVLNNLAWTAAQIKDPKAIEYAETAYRLAPNEASVMDTLGTLLIDKGDTARGIDLLQKASALSPNSPILRLSLAKGLIKANQKEAAKKELDALAKLGDDFPAHAEVEKLRQGL